MSLYVFSYSIQLLSAVFNFIYLIPCCQRHVPYTILLTSCTIYHVVSVIYHIPCFHRHVPYTMLSTSCPIYHFVNVMYHIPCCQCHIPYTMLSTSCTIYHFVNVIYHIPCCQRHVPYTMLSTSYTVYHVVNFMYHIPCCQRHTPYASSVLTCSPWWIRRNENLQCNSIGGNWFRNGHDTNGCHRHCYSVTGVVITLLQRDWRRNHIVTA